ASYEPVDLLAVRDISGVELSPDGSQVLYTVRTAYMDETTSEFQYHLWVDAVDGSASKQFAKGRCGHWSPDGTTLAFLSDRKGELAIYLIPAAGGEARQLTHFKTPVADYRWAPNGQFLAALVKASPDEATVLGRKRLDDAVVVGSLCPRNELWFID